MGTKQGVTVFLVAEKATGERKVAIGSEASGTLLVLNLPELLVLQEAMNNAIAYIEKHGTHITESVPEGAVRH